MKKTIFILMFLAQTVLAKESYKPNLQLLVPGYQFKLNFKCFTPDQFSSSFAQLKDGALDEYAMMISFSF